MGFGEEAIESRVPARNIARGSQIRVSRRSCRDANSVTNERASRVCEAVIEIRIVTADANARKKEAR